MIFPSLISTYVRIHTNHTLSNHTLHYKVMKMAESNHLQHYKVVKNGWKFRHTTGEHACTESRRVYDTH